MRQGGLDGRRAEFFSRWPVGRVLDNSLAGPDNLTPLFYFADPTDTDLSRCTWALGRLGGDLEKRFGLASEVLILFTPYQDLQRRTYNALTRRLRDEVTAQQRDTSGQIRFTPDPTLSILCAPDPRAVEKVESWNLEGGSSLVVPLYTGDDSQDNLRAQLTASLFTVLSDRDLYQGRNPVTGNDFFGRDETLRSLHASFRDGHSIGLFGLRRSGKTSVVREFRRRNANRGFVVIVADLEATASIDELPLVISAEILLALRGLRNDDPSIWLGPVEEHTTATFSELGTRIQRIAQKNSGHTFVFAFDEIESLVPLIEQDALPVRTFLGAMRRAAQSADNVCLLLTGVTSRFFRESMLDEQGRVENPLFGFVEEHFLGPFDNHETANLVRKLGRGMMLRWTDGGLQRVHSLTGGFPFLVRDLASSARAVALQSRDESRVADEVEITAATVDRAFDEWRDAAAGLWTEIVRTLESHHELMAEMVRSADDRELASWLELGDDADRAARSLHGLGLLTRAEESWRLSPTLRSLQALQRAPSAGVDDVRSAAQRRRHSAADLMQLIGRGESSELEFKATARWNLHAQRPDPDITHAVVKTVAAFLNTRGGVLLIGVRDDGLILGVESDIRSSNRSRDRYELFLRDSLRSALGEHVVTSCVDIQFVDVDNQTVVRITVEPHLDGVWCEHHDIDVFYVRNGNQTVKVRNRNVEEYLRSRLR